MRLNDKTVYKLVVFDLIAKKWAKWVVNFNREDDLQINHINYERSVYIHTNTKWNFAVYKEYYQLCEKDRREIYVSAQYESKNSKYNEDIITEENLVRQNNITYFAVINNSKLTQSLKQLKLSLSAASFIKSLTFSSAHSQFIQNQQSQFNQILTDNAHLIESFIKSSSHKWSASVIISEINKVKWLKVMKLYIKHKFTPIKSQSIDSMQKSKAISMLVKAILNAQDKIKSHMNTVNIIICMFNL